MSMYSSVNSNGSRSSINPKNNYRNTNQLLNHLMKLIESNDSRFSFEWLVGGEKGEMGIYDKEKDISYLIKVEPIEYDKNDK